LGKTSEQIKEEKKEKKRQRLSFSRENSFPRYKQNKSIQTKLENAPKKFRPSRVQQATYFPFYGYFNIFFFILWIGKFPRYLQARKYYFLLFFLF
jgi:hypothetical protein